MLSVLVINIPSKVHITLYPRIYSISLTCDLYTQPVIQITPSKSLDLWVFSFKSQSIVQLNSIKNTLLKRNIC